MKGLRLYKKEKLRGATAISRLFSGGESSSAIAYPWRAVWAENDRRTADCAQFLISVPKKRVRHAVDRVTQRRRCREAYRLQRDLLPQGVRVDIAFVYVGRGDSDYAATSRSVAKLLTRVARSFQPDNESD